VPVEESLALEAADVSLELFAHARLGGGEHQELGSRQVESGELERRQDAVVLAVGEAVRPGEREPAVGGLEVAVPPRGRAPGRDRRAHRGPS
jgi:hypothetical protein